MSRLHRWWQAIVLLVIRMRTAASPGPMESIPAAVEPPSSPVPAPVPDIVPVLAMDITPPPAPWPAMPSPPQHEPPPRRLNRHNRRAYERARRKHDRFVEPQGPAPVQQTRAPTQAPVIKSDKQPRDDDPEAPPDDPNDRFIVDEWLEGDGERVLYEEAEFYGEFNFRDTILDQLDRYWIYLDRMRKHDPDAYGLYRQIGAVLVPYAGTQSFSDQPHEIKKITDIEAYKRDINLSAWFRQNWPAFGCSVYGANPREEAAEAGISKSGGHVWTPKFLYFHRISRMPWTVQPVRGGKLYMLTVWWDHVGKMDGREWKWGRPENFPIQIHDDGSIRVLKTREHTNGEVGQWWDWRLPHGYHAWAKQHGIPAQLHIAHLFTDAVRHVEHQAYAMLRIEVSKGDQTAVFGLSPRRTAYFFQDRDFVLTETGAKKRIFHMVRPHVRLDGTRVPTHFRGLRKFSWAGYAVRITVPGKDHFMPLEFDVPATAWEHRDKGMKYVDGPEVGRRLKEQMYRGVGRHA